MFAVSYLNLQMFWPRYIHLCVDTDEPIITVEHGHTAGNIWEKNPCCKIRKNSQQTSVISGSQSIQLY